MTKGGAPTRSRSSRPSSRGVNAEQFLKTIKEWNAAGDDRGCRSNPAVKDGRSTRGLAVPKSPLGPTRSTRRRFEAYAVTLRPSPSPSAALKTSTEGEVESTERQHDPGPLLPPAKLVGGLFLSQLPRRAAGLVSGAVLGKLAGDGAGKIRQGKELKHDFRHPPSRIGPRRQQPPAAFVRRRAQAAWPAGPVTFLVGYAAGGSTDHQCPRASDRS